MNYKIYSDKNDEGVINQIEDLIENTPFSNESHIRIMPDTHIGKGCVIGFSAKLENFIIPNVIGVDIGCGMLVIPIGKKEIILDKLDRVIHKVVPHGTPNFKNRDAEDNSVHKTALSDHIQSDIQNIKAPIKNIGRIYKSLGTLGGGNHFIELAQNEKGFKYLVIHSGSRNLGHQIATYYQNKAYENFIATKEHNKRVKLGLFKAINSMTDGSTYYPFYEGILKEIKLDTNNILKLQHEIFDIFEKNNKLPSKEQSWLKGEDKKDYIFDMKITQKFASRNRFWIGYNILKEYGLDTKSMKEAWETCHNFIDFNDKIIRKGSARAHLDENVIIPINMRDGSILGIGKGNEEWNYSAPHGAGRTKSRTEAKSTLKMDDVVKQMENVYTTTLSEKTIDEAPDAYNSIEYIKENIKDSVEIKEIIKPIYNFKG